MPLTSLTWCFLTWSWEWDEGRRALCHICFPREAGRWPRKGIFSASWMKWNVGTVDAAPGWPQANLSLLRNGTGSGER